jgi:hypothetical protein
MATIIQLRGDTAANWTTVNPILAERELAFETDTNLYKIGDGVTPWNTLPYKALRQIDEAAIINFSDQNPPTAPATNTLNLFARQLGGRMALRMQGPSGLSTPLQPSFFQNNITMINTNATTSVTSIGNTVTSVGTISHPVPTFQYGYMTNFASAATAAATAGTGNNGLIWVRSNDFNDASGFFFNARLAFPDSNYNETGASTGTRIFVGFNSDTLANVVASNNPGGSRVGFSRIHVNGSLTETEWQITSRDGVNENRFSTGMLFTAECVYDFYIFCPPDGSFIGWRIDNITLGTSESGSFVNNMPAIGTYMRGGFQIQTVNAVGRNIRMQRVYIESDR